MITAVLLTIACFIATMTEAINSSNGWPLFIILSLVSGISIYRYIKKDDAYTDDFKKNIISEIVTYLNPGIIYKPDAYVSSKEYRRSCLYRKHYDYYEGDDLLQGKYKEVSFYCSEIHTYYVSGRGHYTTIFKGLFFVGAVNENFTAGTYVWTRDEDQFARSIGEELRLLPMPEVTEMHMHYEPFEKYFCVCSTDPREARSILTPAMMDLLVKFRKQLGRKISFSVVAGRCYVAIPISEDLLEPSADPTNKEEIKKHFFTVLLVFSIINQLELNRLG